MKLNPKAALQLVGFVVVFLFFPSYGWTQNVESESRKQIAAMRISAPIMIDGIANDAAWAQAPKTSDFIQFSPDHGKTVRQRTTVRIAYDDQALYVLAELWDTAPDSILKQFGARDNFGVNADFFKIAIDPYGKHQVSYEFGVTAAGVQFDQKLFDLTFDAVWESAVRIDDRGWYAEFKIPYSAFRFPSMDDQQWSLQLNRSIRRFRELDSWSLVPPEADNPLVYWGHLTDLKNINPPLRLSLTPYVSTYAESVPYVKDLEGNVGYQRGFSYSAGADLKYGIDERFTIDVSLLPDFGQVQSDKKVKNLSYQEDVYDENRTFFKEGADLFDRNSLFYSRRIGKTPSGFNSLKNDTTRVLLENPSVVKLLNAVRFSGRTGNGLGIGVFNAVTDNMYAVAQNADGSTSKILTEPLTNYSAIVLDQDLKNNSEVYFYNTNVMREGSFSDANVTNAGFYRSNRKKTWGLGFDGGVSHRTNRYMSDGSLGDETGYAYRGYIEKLSGAFNFRYERLSFDALYQSSDLGFQTINDANYNEFEVTYNLYEPKGIIRSSYNEIDYNIDTRHGSNSITTNRVSASSFTTLLNYLTLFAGFDFTPGDYYDFNEPRVPGRFQKGFKYWSANGGFSTDYRKTLAVDQRIYVFSKIDLYKGTGYSSNTNFRLRLSDRANIKLSVEIDNVPYDIGFSDVDDAGNIIYGIRDLTINTVQLTGSYSFNKDMILSLNARHYRSYAEHSGYATLLSDGSLEANTVYSKNNNFDYNIFNVDLAFSWMFAPGSTLSVVYKNIIENELNSTSSFNPYGSNLERLLREPQTNSVSLKALYYLDYARLLKSKP
jgi:hypothetical protein